MSPISLPVVPALTSVTVVLNKDGPYPHRLYDLSHPLLRGSRGSHQRRRLQQEAESTHKVAVGRKFNQGPLCKDMGGRDTAYVLQDGGGGWLSW